MEVIKSDIFIKWLSKLNDKIAKVDIARKIDQIRYKNHFGDFKNLGDKICEIRIHISKGYRLYFSVVNGEVVILLCGGDKSTQQKDIQKAKEILQEYLKGLENER
ncbi:MAG: type II toxin-antitoxin system RelE/ParE family toxin [Campylobacter sp.]|nr:type II toxin-antitoxin system RelE/ParE family toxin [Campylobacter sp.]